MYTFFYPKQLLTMRFKVEQTESRADLGAESRSDLVAESRGDLEAGPAIKEADQRISVAGILALDNMNHLVKDEFA